MELNHDCSKCGKHFSYEPDEISSIDPFWYEGPSTWGIVCPWCLSFDQFSDDELQKLQQLRFA